MTTARAFAKLTLSLRVLGRREDGFHDLEGLVVSLGQPHDTLQVTGAAGDGVTLAVVTEAPDVPSGADNLAARAAATLLEAAGSDAGVRIALTKRIPAGAGLGGASADAAAALVATRAALDLDIDDTTLDRLGATLGSDVPFCLRGGAAWMRGRGERIEPVDVPLGLPMLVAVPPFRCATEAVYAAWDDLGGPQARRTVPAPARVAGFLGELANDLEPAAEQVEPRLVEFRERLEEVVGRSALLAGSGSAYVVPLDDPRTLPDAAAEVSERFGGEVIPAATVSRGVKLSR